MESLSKTSAAGATREKELSVPPTATASGAVFDSLSLASYKDYPVHRPFINTAQTRRHQSGRLTAPVKAFPETSSAVILSGLRSLQEKIRRLELEKDHAELSLRSLGRDVSYTPHRSENITQRLLNNQTDTHKELRDPSNCNQVLITHLAAAESRCVKLERQLDHMRRMLHNAKADRTSLLKQQCQVSRDTANSAHQQQGTVSEHAQLEKLERLEQEYLRLTRTQNNTEIKMNELELKLQEEKLQRRLIQDQAQRLQSGLEANRILLQSVSPRRSATEKEKKSNAKKSLKQRSSHTKPHYRLSFRDVPFVAGMSAGCSHSVRANVQSVLSLLKQHQPHLCNSRVLSNSAKARDAGGSSGHSDSESSSSTSCGEELSELLLALQDELRLMSMEQDELMRQVEDSVSGEERRELQREQERLLLKMERKGEQISKLLKHRTQMKKLKKEAISRRSSKSEVKVTNTMSTRGRCAAAARLSPGESSRRNLRLLRDMKALQTSLGT